MSAALTQSSVEDDELTAALEQCASEPIHLSGAIQPHGYLVVLDEHFVIQHVSANVPTLLEQPADAILGQPITNIIQDASCDELASMSNEHESMPVRSTIMMLPVHGQLQRFDAMLHRNHNHILLELEPQLTQATAEPQADFYQHVIAFSMQLQKVTDKDRLHDYLVREVKRITGFARVKLYRFDEEWNGQVIAEARDELMPSYLGLHFPHSDIPPQARALYAQNHLRFIANASYEPVPILGPDIQAEPIDLSHSVLRSVSPVHLEYLRNMNVGASMSISIMQNDKLWGLIACHHPEPYQVPYAIRMAAALFGHTFSAFLSNFDHAIDTQMKNQKEQFVRELWLEMEPNKRLIDVIREHETRFLELVHADGAVISLDGESFSIGQTPEADFTRSLIAWLEQHGNEPVFASNTVSRDIDLPLNDHPLASGVLVTPVSRHMNHYIVWFRKEQSAKVTWAGKPEKTLANDDGTMRLSPRASFEQWQEHVRGRARAWQPPEIDMAERVIKLLLAQNYKDHLRQYTQDLHSILNYSSAHIYITDLDGVVINVNSAMLTAFDWQYDETIGQSIYERLGGEIGVQMRANQERVIAAQESITFEKDFIYQGREFHLLAVKFPLYDTKDTIYAVCTIATDISQLRETEQELVRSNQELERMAFIASHDLQEPIRMIANFTQLLDTRYHDQFDETAKSYIAFILESTDRMRSLINDLLDYSRTGHDEVNPEDRADTRAEIDYIIHQTIDLQETPAGQIQTEGNWPTIPMKAGHFNCVMQNLISNGLKYCPPERTPTVTLRCEETDDAYTFSVADNGIGIEPQYFDRIFMIFQRLHSSKAYTGTGIGLALCARLVRHYNGHIWLKSDPGQGSTFYFSVPKKVRMGGAETSGSDPL